MARGLEEVRGPVSHTRTTPRDFAFGPAGASLVALQGRAQRPDPHAHFACLHKVSPRNPHHLCFRYRAFWGLWLLLSLVGTAAMHARARRLVVSTAARTSC